MKKLQSYWSLKIICKKIAISIIYLWTLDEEIKPRTKMEPFDNQFTYGRFLDLEVLISKTSFPKVSRIQLSAESFQINFISPFMSWNNEATFNF